MLEYGNKYAESFNFGPTEESVLRVSEVTKKVVEYYDKGEVVIHKKDDLHEANLLMLNIDKARQMLGWIPTYTADEVIAKTIEWYKHFYQKDLDMYELTIRQIEEFEERVKWAK